MTENEIREKLLSLIKGELEIDAEIDTTQSLLQSDVMDSMDWISYLTIVEENFDIEISSEEANKYQIGIVDNFVKYLKKKIDDKISRE